MRPATLKRRQHAFPAPQHRFGAIIALLLVTLVVAPPVPARAATNVVTNCSGNAVTPGSLAAVLAIAAANDTITFAQDCTGTNAITVNTTLVPPVTVTIDAAMPPHMIVVDGGRTGPYNGVSVFAVNTGVQATFRGLTIQHGFGNGGGAIFNRGILNVVGCTFFGNISGAGTGGGAIDNRNTLTVVDSTFFGNGAGNRADNNAGGGAISNSGTLNVVGSTFSGNGASGSGFGGAIMNNGTLRLTLSVVARNYSIHGTDIFGPVTTDGGGNMVDDTMFSSGLIAPSDKLNVPALLAPPGNYGGTLQTVALLPGSPAIDIAACPTDPITGATLTTDARNVPRPQPIGAGSLCDSGSFESHGFTLAALSGSGQSAGVSGTFTAPLVAQITANDNGVPVDGVSLTFATPVTGASAALTPAGGVTTTDTTGKAQVTATANGTLGMYAVTASLTGPTAGVTSSASFALTNAPAPVALLLVSGFPSPVLSGTAGSVTVTAEDSFDDVATGYTGTVKITSSDPAATLPANATLINGVGTFPVILRTPGTQSITAIDTMTGTIIGTQTDIIVTGTAPTAANDNYTTVVTMPVSVLAATGVLTNDSRGVPAAMITAYTQSMHTVIPITLNPDGSFTYAPTMGYVGPDSFTYTLTNSVGSSTATVNLTVNAATLIDLTVTAPPANGSTMPTLRPGDTVALTTVGQFNNGTTGPVSGLIYTSSNASVATVDPAGVVAALTGGRMTVTVTAPNGTRTTITVTVTTATGTGLVPPNAQPMIHVDAPTAAATPVSQPAVHPADTGTGSGWRPHAVSQPTGKPDTQPSRH